MIYNIVSGVVHDLPHCFFVVHDLPHCFQCSVYFIMKIDLRNLDLIESETLFPVDPYFLKKINASKRKLKYDGL